MCYLLLQRFALLACVSLLLSACSATPAQKGAVIKAHSVLLLPMSSLHQEIISAENQLEQQLIKQLKKKRFTTISLSDAQYQNAVDGALAASGAVYDPAIGHFLPIDRLVYIKALIDILYSTYDFDVLIQPELLLRQVNITGDMAVWDGVERKVELTRKAEIPYRPLKQGRGVSIKLSAYSNQGADLLQSYAGISLPYTIDYNERPAALAIKKVLFSEKEQTQAAQVALTPFFYQVKYHAKKSQ